MYMLAHFLPQIICLSGKGIIINVLSYVLSYVLYINVMYFSIMFKYFSNELSTNALNSDLLLLFELHNLMIHGKTDANATKLAAISVI